jgi:hypothetical protein
MHLEVDGDSCFHLDRLAVQYIRFELPLPHSVDDRLCQQFISLYHFEKCDVSCRVYQNF